MLSKLIALFLLLTLIKFESVLNLVPPGYDHHTTAPPSRYVLYCYNKPVAEREIRIYKEKNAKVECHKAADADELCECWQETGYNALKFMMDNSDKPLPSSSD
ncbi:Uncharacterised protein g4512 [Pycnogonum litorale]